MTPWPYSDTMFPHLPCGEWELDAACWRKRQTVLTPDQVRAVDETAGLCGVCSGECPSPQACERPEPPRVVDTLRRQRAIALFLAVLLGAVICGVSLVGYLRVPS